MSPPVIVTRTLPGADETASHLTALGYRAILSPMLQIVETGLEQGALDGVRDIVLTSVNGVHALSRAGADPAEMTAWCVGPSTSAAATAAGFGRVVEGDGDADDLGRLILTARSELSGPALHIANDAAAGHLVAALRADGLDARFAAAYRTEAAPSLSAEALAALNSGAAAVLVHSAKGASALAASNPPLTAAVLVAISEAAAAPVRATVSKQIIVSERPNEAGLFAALGEAFPA